jgi:hypothetical protein
LDVGRWMFENVSSFVCSQKIARCFPPSLEATARQATALGMTTFAKPCGFEPLRRQG